MKHRKTLLLLALIISITSCGTSQSNTEPEPKLVGGPCEGCEAVFEYGDQKLSSVDTLPDFGEEGSKISVMGTVYRPDGTTPARDVILYVYHTNQNGLYATQGDEEGWGRRHGYIRGWVKTGSDGRYTFYTLKPAPYPNRTDPAHIHLTILEPNGKYYWIGGAEPGFDAEPGTDFEAVSQGCVSVTPLGRDVTHYASLDALSALTKG